VGEGIHDNIDTEWVRDSFGVEAKVLAVCTLTLPAISDIIVVAKEGHESVSVIEVAPKVWAFIALRVAMPIFEGMALLPGEDAGHLRDAFKIVDESEQFMVVLEFPWLPIWEDALHLLSNILHGGRSPKIIGHKKPAPEEVSPKSIGFFVVEGHVAHVGHVSERVIKQLGVGQLNNLSVGIDLERGEFVESDGKIPIAIRKVVVPISAPSRRSSRIVSNPYEGEHVGLETLLMVPRDIVTSSRCARTPASPEALRFDYRAKNQSPEESETKPSGGI